MTAIRQQRKPHLTNGGFFYVQRKAFTSLVLNITHNKNQN